MISVLFTPSVNTKEFEDKFYAINNTLNGDREYLAALIKTDPMLEWFVNFCDNNGIKKIILPDLGYTTCINILAARASGKYIYYSSPFSTFSTINDAWDIKIIEKVKNIRDNIFGVMLSNTTNNLKCDSLVIPQKVYCILGYYIHPLFESALYGTRWSASILTEVNRLYNISCDITYTNNPNVDALTTDNELFGITRKCRLVHAAKLNQFMEKDND